MLRAMRTAASGMSAQQLYLDTIAHNLEVARGHTRDSFTERDAVMNHLGLRPACIRTNQGSDMRRRLVDLVHFTLERARKRVANAVRDAGCV